MSTTFSGTKATISVSGASHSHDSYTGYTQPTFTGTTVTSTANSRDHTHGIDAHSHTINSGNTSTSGTKTTVGFRGIQAITESTINTDNTNAKTLTGSITGGTGFGKYDSGSATGIFTVTGNGLRATTESGTGNKYTIDATHRHQITPTGYLYGKTDTLDAFNSGGESQDHTHDVTPKGTVQNHRHTISSSGTLSMSGTYTPAGSVTIGAGDSETRPDNYSYVIWKRIA